MQVTIFGTGYVGLVTGTCLAEVGHHVVCVDIDQAKVEGLNRGVIPIYEPGLEDLVRANHGAGRLEFTTDAAAAIAQGEILFIAVGTPPDEDGSADLQYVLAVARTIGQHLARPAVVVNKSTVPVGTAERVREAIAAQLQARGVDLAFDVVSNPEFLKEGAAVADCLRPDRIVLGARSAGAVEKMKRLYAPFNRNHERIVVMDERSAELTKYAANAMLATKISFMNEMANIARAGGRRHRDGAPWHRFGPAHRLQLHLPGRRLRRLVLPEGRAGAGPDRAPARLHGRAAGGGGGGEPRPEAQAVRAGVAAFRREAGGAAVRGLGPGVQAQHRRHARGLEPDPAGAAVAGGRQRAGARSRGDGGGGPDLRRAPRPAAVPDAGKRRWKAPTR